MSASNWERARRSLLSLRGDFEIEARRNQDLHNVLFCASNFEHPKASERPPIPGLDDIFTCKRAWCGLEGKPLLILYYYGRLELLDHKFSQLAEHALRAWEGLARLTQEHPRQTSDAEPEIDWTYEDLLRRFDTLSDRPDVPLWLLVVHALAWKRLPGSPLIANREIWDRSWPVFGHFTLPYESQQRQKALESLSAGLRESLRDQPLPDFFFSVLPCNVFRASVFAIDLLLEMNASGDWIADVEGNPPRLSPQILSSPPVHEAEVSSMQKELFAQEARTRRSGGYEPTSILAMEEMTPGQNPPLRRRASRKESELKAAAYLLGRSVASIREVSEAIGASVGLVCKLEAWKTFQHNRQRNGQGTRTRNTKDGKLDLTRINDDPSKYIELIEVIQPYYMDRASPTQRAEYHRLGPREKSNHLHCFMHKERERLVLLHKGENKSAVEQAFDKLLADQDFETIISLIPQIEEQLKDS